MADATPGSKPANPIQFRFRFLVYPKFQIALVLFNAAIVTVGFLIVFYGYHVFLENLHARGVVSGLDPNHYYFVFLENEFKTLYQITMGAYVGTLVICTAVTLFISQRLAGPIVRLRKYFRDQGLAQGEFKQPISFRKGDFFSDLPDLINDSIAKTRASK